MLLDKRLKGDRLAVLGYLSAAADTSNDGGRAGIAQGEGGAFGPSVGDRGGGEVVGGGGLAAAAEAPRETVISSFG